MYLPVPAGDRPGPRRLDGRGAADPVGLPVRLRGRAVRLPGVDRSAAAPLRPCGLGSFLAASVACALAPSIEALVGARFVQALGASGPIVLGGRSCATSTRARAGRELSRMGTIMGLVPAIAPICGGVLAQGAFGWRANFWAATAVRRRPRRRRAALMPETILARARRARSRSVDPARLRQPPGAPGYRVYVALSALAYGGLFAFISGSSFVLQGIYGLAEMALRPVLRPRRAGLHRRHVLAQRLVGRAGSTAPSGSASPPSPLGGRGDAGPGPRRDARRRLRSRCRWRSTRSGVGLTMPQAMASAMMPFPDRAGAASSLLGICQMSFAAAGRHRPRPGSRRLGAAPARHRRGRRARGLRGLSRRRAGASKHDARKWTPLRESINDINNSSRLRSLETPPARPHRRQELQELRSAARRRPGCARHAVA